MNKVLCLFLFAHRWRFVQSRSIGGGLEHRTYRCARCGKTVTRRVKLEWVRG